MKSFKKMQLIFLHENQLVKKYTKMEKIKDKQIIPGVHKVTIEL